MRRLRNFVANLRRMFDEPPMVYGRPMLEFDKPCYLMNDFCATHNVTLYGHPCPYATPRESTSETAWPGRASVKS